MPRAHKKAEERRDRSSRLGTCRAGCSACGRTDRQTDSRMRTECNASFGSAAKCCNHGCERQRPRLQRGWVRLAASLTSPTALLWQVGDLEAPRDTHVQPPDWAALPPLGLHCPGNTRYLFGTREERKSRGGGGWQRWGQPDTPQALRSRWRPGVQVSGRAVGWGGTPGGHWDPTTLVFQGDCPSDPSHKANPVLP